MAARTVLVSSAWKRTVFQQCLAPNGGHQRLSSFAAEFWQRKKSIKRSFRANVDDANVLSSPAPDLDLKFRPFHEYVWEGEAAHKWPDRTAIEDAVSGKKYTFEEGRVLSSKYAKIMQELELSRGDVVVICLPNCPDYPVFAGAASKISAVSSLMNPTFKPTEAARQFAVAKPKLVITMEEHVKMVSKALTEHDLDVKPMVLSLDALQNRRLTRHVGILSLDQLLKEINSGDYKPVTNNPDDVAILPFSSGTTGDPKGVMLTHKQLVYNLQQKNDNEMFDYRIPCSDDFQGVTICTLPMYHIYGFSAIMSSSLNNGNKVVSLPKFGKESFSQAIKTHKPDYLAVTPPLVSIMAESNQLTADDLSCIRYLAVSAAPSGKELMGRIRTKMPDVMFVEGYGMTEASPSICTSPVGHNVPNSCGQPLPNTRIKVVDTVTGENLPVNHQGELCISGPQIMKGYLDNEEATSECINDGWFHTGDVGYFDREGNVFITGRIKELIKVKGLQVSPTELEDVLQMHGAISDSAVIGVPHEKFGEAPRAYVVPKEGEELTEEQVHDFMRERVSDYKQLVGGIRFVEEIPKTPTGKIERRKIADSYLKTKF